jgi:hypothetical protein
MADDLIYGMMAEFDEPGKLVAAAQKAYAAGYRQMDGYSPFPVEGLHEALGHKASILPFIVLAGGIAGALGGFGLQYFGMVIGYPLNIGGRPLNSWPAFIPIAFETTILLAGLAAVFGMLALNGLPQPYHPVFNVPNFEHASRDRFFLCIEASDPLFELEKTRAFMATLDALEVNEVDRLWNEGERVP